MGDKGLEGCQVNPVGGNRVGIVEFIEFIWGRNVLLWDPRIFLISVPFPFYEELNPPSCELAVQDLFHHIVFFPID